MKADRMIDLTVLNIFLLPHTDKNPTRASSIMLKEDLDNENGSGDRTNVRSIDISRRISDNPFDVLSSSLYKQGRENKVSNAMMAKDEFRDDIFREFLIKRRTEAEHVKKDLHYAIYTKMKILARHEIEIETRKMYKFPFELDTKNDGSQLFRSLYSEYLVAIRSIFKEYRTNNSEFYLKLGNDFLCFGPELRTTKGMRRLLVNNEISFKEEADFLLVEGMEILLVFDYIINVPLSSSFVIPFILSEGQFSNSISFSIRLQKGPVVRKDRELLYSYDLLGPLWSGEYTNLTEHEHEFL